MKLLYSRNPNPRLAVAAARQVRAPVTFEFAAPLAPGQAERYRRLTSSPSSHMVQFQYVTKQPEDWNTRPHRSFRPPPPARERLNNRHFERSGKRFATAKPVNHCH